MAALIAAFFSSPALSQTKVSRSVTVDEDFQSANLRWNNATAGGYDALVALKGDRGVIELCGVGVVTNIQLSSSIKNSLRGGTLKINGKTVVKDFSFFAKAKSARALKKANANCVSTGVKSSTKINDISLDYGDGTFRN
ncbi:hypothetical protein [uncultured Litoreibacter sp.]|uniref:hypothetical protein n=1 Tax=uncultured Litoreibacter sp. TaxID=1392394 RepID=UPI0026361B55|nr:hypothetical protein [uncultured Litoreibacter sp.]